jgi:hypothetical protein
MASFVFQVSSMCSTWRSQISTSDAANSAQWKARGNHPDGMRHILLSPLYTPHPTPPTLHLALRTLHSRSRLRTLLSALHTPRTLLYPLHFAFNIPHFTAYTKHSTSHVLRTLHSALYSPHSTVHALHPLHTPSHITPRTLHSTIHTPRW